MSDAVDDLLALLALEPLEGDLFRGTGAGGETRLRIFGGQVVAQGLAAASQTVDPARRAHSLHAYFLRPGDPTRPVIYDVDRARDGGSFTTRRVVAMQDGRQILNMAASFHRKEAGYDHAHDMGDWPPPEELAPREALKARVAATADPARRADILRPSAIDVRPIDPVDYAAPEPKADRHAAWLRLSRPVTGLEAWQERCLLAYISDLLLLWSALRPHGLSGYDRQVMTASLDHALWIHRTPAMSDWHLYVMDSPWTGDGRGLTRGALYDRAGRHVASTAQEGLVRPRSRGT